MAFHGQVGNTASESYKKIYWFSWKCFQAADADRDGQVLVFHQHQQHRQHGHWSCQSNIQVSGDEFATMIAISTANQKRLGLPAPFQTGEERDACFKVIMMTLVLVVMMMVMVLMLRVVMLAVVRIVMMVKLMMEMMATIVMMEMMAN